MTRHDQGYRGPAGTVARLAPLLIPIVPKCPLCLLPLFAAVGSALPSRPLLNGLVAVSAAAWLGLVLSTARWLPVRVAAVAAATLLVAGRLSGSAWAPAAGAALVLAVAVWTRFRPRACSAKACAGPAMGSGANAGVQEFRTDPG